MKSFGVIRSSKSEQLSNFSNRITHNITIDHKPPINISIKPIEENINISPHKVNVHVIDNTTSKRIKADPALPLPPKKPRTHKIFQERNSLQKSKNNSHDQSFFSQRSKSQRKLIFAPFIIDHHKQPDFPIAKSQKQESKIVLSQSSEHMEENTKNELYSVRTYREKKFETQKKPAIYEHQISESGISRFSKRNKIFTQYALPIREQSAERRYKTQQCIEKPQPLKQYASTQEQTNRLSKNYASTELKSSQNRIFKQYAPVNSSHIIVQENIGEKLSEKSKTKKINLVSSKVSQFSENGSIASEKSSKNSKMSVHSQSKKKIYLHLTKKKSSIVYNNGELTVYKYDSIQAFDI